MWGSAGCLIKAIDDEQDFEFIIKEYMNEFSHMTETEMVDIHIFVLENLGIYQQVHSLRVGTG